MSEFSFVDHYKRSNVIFIVDKTCDNEVRKVKLRTVMDTYMVGNEDKNNAVFIGMDKKDMIFLSAKEAALHAKTVVKPWKDIESEDEDDILKYIERGDEDE